MSFMFMNTYSPVESLAHMIELCLPDPLHNEKWQNYPYETMFHLSSFNTKTIHLNYHWNERVDDTSISMNQFFVHAVKG